MTNCVNLKRTFGGKYRIRHDESYKAESGVFRSAEEPWLQIIPCDHGHICPWGGELLAISTDKRGGIARQIMALPCVSVVQDGQDGINATFPVENFEEVAAIVKPKRRRYLSAERRARMSAIGTANLARYRNAKAQADSSGPERTQPPEADSEPA